MDLKAFYSVDKIRSIKKIELKLSFKRIKSRSNNVDLDKLKSIGYFFAFRFTQIIDKNKSIANIHEAYINRSIKRNYSWGLKGVPIELLKFSFAESATLIINKCSNGALMNMTLSQTIDSIYFT